MEDAGAQSKVAFAGLVLSRGNYVNTNDDQELQIVDVEIQLKAAGLSQDEVDARSRKLATQLRLLPHKSVGIISKQIPESANESLPATTEGKIALSLPAAALSAVVKLLQKDRGFILKNLRLGGGARVTQTGGAKEDSNSSKKYPELVRFWLSKLHK